MLTSGARDASETGHQSWQVHALLWSPIQAGPVGAEVGWGVLFGYTACSHEIRTFLNGFQGNCIDFTIYVMAIHGNFGWFWKLSHGFYIFYTPGVALPGRIWKVREGRRFADAHSLLPRAGDSSWPCRMLPWANKCQMYWKVWFVCLCMPMYLAVCWR